MSNTLTVDQVSSVLRKVLSQATGRTDLGALDVNQLLTIGQTTMLTAPDPLLNSISQVLSKTLFSARKYKAKMAALRADPTRYGNMVRKLKIIDKETDLDNSEYLSLKEGSSVDMYQVDKTDVLQLNFYGQQTHTVQKTIFKRQFDTCFNSAAEFAQFMAMVLTYVANKIEKIHEETARATLSGLMGGIIAGETAGVHTGRVVHLVQEYNAVTGLTLDTSTIYKPENFPGFVKWVYARVQTLCTRMGEYSKLYQTNTDKGSIDQHTPLNKIKAFYLAPFFDQAQNQVLADTYHDKLLNLAVGGEMVSFWQAIETPDSINISKASYLAKDGTVAAGSPLEQANIFGVLLDEDAAGYTPIFESVDITPYNAKGEYWNQFWHFNERHWLDFTEKAIVLLLD